MNQPPRTPHRRSFLRSGLVVGGGAFALAAMDGLAARAALAELDTTTSTTPETGGYGPLRDVTRTDPQTGFQQTLALPDGFDFSLFGLAGTTMDDGHRTPLGHDGMAAFPGPEGTVRLVRNHEERSAPTTALPAGSPAQRYDSRGGGGTSTIQLRLQADGTPRLERIWQSLSGTIVNCAGGPTPWGSWLSCEETTAGVESGWQRPHGYVFEVPAGAGSEVTPEPITAMGRFVHEAVALDPRSGIVYQTEDRDTAGFYRYIPQVPGNLAAGGRVQMLKVRDAWAYDTRSGQRRNRPMRVEWVDIDDPDPAEAENNPQAVYDQGIAKGAATFGRLEGCTWGHGAVYLVSTDGGDANEGQVWEFRPAGDAGGLLSLVYESPDRDVLSFPDNITVSPRRSLLLCEDTSRSGPALQGLTRNGQVFPFCIDGDTEDEWAGATFSPDGSVLFVNLQGSTSGDPRDSDSYARPGRTLAIWGPWQDGIL
ncbi:DUF839 domain-containing protein [Lipingzhangella sp. LS1_29]|uniref:DUF839 domain-containing protein n=1 Tax=Lipingzhangella rawalii TaxID=2055835 RepID=A0ABU2H1N7_9ACTN|nr:alkaline phosphatase PhoX [Lipingzhangella rawalii]MDS1269217.1 DUF839 domain-containing protein [Lipingzhangella rawalii]